MGVWIENDVEQYKWMWTVRNPTYRSAVCFIISDWNRMPNEEKETSLRRSAAHYSHTLRAYSWDFAIGRQSVTTKFAFDVLLIRAHLHHIETFTCDLMHILNRFTLGNRHYLSGVDIATWPNFRVNINTVTVSLLLIGFHNLHHSIMTIRR